MILTYNEILHGHQKQWQRYILGQNDKSSSLEHARKTVQGSVHGWGPRFSPAEPGVTGSLFSWAARTCGLRGFLELGEGEPRAQGSCRMVLRKVDREVEMGCLLQGEAERGKRGEQMGPLGSFMLSGVMCAMLLHCPSETLVKICLIHQYFRSRTFCFQIRWWILSVVQKWVLRGASVVQVMYDSVMMSL